MKGGGEMSYILALVGVGLSIYGYNKHKAYMFQQGQLFQEKLPLCQQFITKLESYNDSYLMTSEILKLSELWNNINDEFQQIRISNKYPDYQMYKQFQSYRRDIDDSFTNRNNSFVQNEMATYKDFFDNIEGKSLTTEQREIAIRIDNNNLIVASAGSGKTLTIIGNVLYLIKKGVNPKDILVLSFNKKIAKEIKERFANLGEDIATSTFHSLGMNLCKQSQQAHVFDENLEKQFLTKFLDDLLNNKQLTSSVLKYFAYYLYPIPDLTDFEDLGEHLRQTQHIDMNTLKQHWEDKYIDGTHVETLQGERVKSLGELVIANYLFLNGIEYKYETPYPVEEFAYKPDFYLTEYDLWLEHFGVLKKANGQLTGITDTYIAEMNLKKDTHQKQGTTLISTYFYEFINEDFWDILTTRLKEYGVVTKPPNLEKLQQNISAIKEQMPFRSFLKNLVTFLNLYKGNGEKNISMIKSKMLADKDIAPYSYKRNLLFLDIFEQYHTQYEEFLKSSNHIDFNDMLLNAISLVENTHPFKYIYVDEYQDTSLLRFRLVEAIAKKHNAIFTAIGDDWQSIYRFAGSDISLFTHFKDYVSTNNRLDLSQTYRYSQELTQISARFIQQNPEQFKKRVYSTKTLKNPVLIAEYKDFADMFSNDSLYTRFISAMEGIIDKEEIKTVLILGRNNGDLKNSGLLGDIEVGFMLKNNSPFNQQTVKLTHHAYPNIDFEFRTIHRAKGSEADLVFVLNNKNHLSGFPNKMESDPLFKYLVDNSENYAYAEERRLFYVALTRTRTYTVLMTSHKEPSEFVEEIKAYPNVKTLSIQESAQINHRCPYCKSGRIILKQNKNKEFYGDCEFHNCPGNSKLGNAVLVDDDYIRCSNCGGIMIERTQKKTGEKFFGCSNFNVGLCKKTMRATTDYKTLSSDVQKYKQNHNNID